MLCAKSGNCLEQNFNRLNAKKKHIYSYLDKHFMFSDI